MSKEEFVRLVLVAVICLMFGGLFDSYKWGMEKGEQEGRIRAFSHMEYVMRDRIEWMESSGIDHVLGEGAEKLSRVNLLKRFYKHIVSETFEDCQNADIMMLSYPLEISKAFGEEK